MTESRGYCLFLLVTCLAGSSSGTRVSSISVCLNDSVQLFQGIVTNSGSYELSLYLNGMNYTLVAMWSMKNSTLSTNILPNYKEKVFRGKDGSIGIRNVNLSDEAKYVLQYDIDNFSTKSSTKSEVLLEVMVAPKKDCVPKIRRMNSLLNASVDANVCGKPVVSVNWLDVHGNPFRSKTINLPPESEVGTYFACIEGPALACANTLKQSDQCSSYTVGERVVNRYVCLGDSVHLIDSGDTDVSMYKSGANDTFFAKWSTKNSVITSTIPSKYKQKVHLDGNGSLWIQNINTSDEGKYIIQYEKNGSYSNSEVQIHAMTAPTQLCKPKIQRVDNILYASLEVEYCGTPAASVSWSDLHGNFDMNATLKLLPGREAGTYYACIKGPALKCALKQSEYCSTHTIERSVSPQSAIVNTPQIASLVALAIVVVILLVVVIRVYWRKFSARSEKSLNAAQAPDPMKRNTKGSWAKFIDGIHFTKKLRFPCPMQGCEKKYSTKASVQQHISEHFSGFMTAGNLAVTRDMGNGKFHIIYPEKPPSDSQASACQATTAIEEITPLTGTVETKIEALDEVLDSEAKCTTGSNSNQSKNTLSFHCPMKPYQHTYSSIESIRKQVQEQFLAFMTTGKIADLRINKSESNINLENAFPDTLPSQSQLSSGQSTTFSDGVTSILEKGGSKFEPVVELHEVTIEMSEGAQALVPMLNNSRGNEE